MSSNKAKQKEYTDCARASIKQILKGVKIEKCCVSEMHAFQGQALTRSQKTSINNSDNNAII